VTAALEYRSGGKYPDDLHLRPVRTITHRYVIEHLIYGEWTEITSAASVADGRQIIDDFDEHYKRDPSRIVYVSTATERRVIE